MSNEIKSRRIRRFSARSTSMCLSARRKQRPPRPRLLGFRPCGRQPQPIGGVTSRWSHPSPSPARARPLTLSAFTLHPSGLFTLRDGIPFSLKRLYDSTLPRRCPDRVQEPHITSERLGLQTVVWSRRLKDTCPSSSSE